ncbi:MAG: hypothetical protein HYX46_00125 [Betaproteobacteria bacterium]|nr:hypothetical protein [Betaproteobacteria bacterium]
MRYVVKLALSNEDAESPFVTMRATLMSAMSDPRLRKLRAALVALMFVALGVMLLRPLHEVTVAAQDEPAGICCASVENDTFVKPADPVDPGTPGPGNLVAAVSSALLLFGLYRPHACWRVPPGGLPSQLPFYARSARIRR